MCVCVCVCVCGSSRDSFQLNGSGAYKSVLPPPKAVATPSATVKPAPTPTPAPAKPSVEGGGSPSTPPATITPIIRPPTSVMDSKHSSANANSTAEAEVEGSTGPVRLPLTRHPSAKRAQQTDVSYQHLTDRHHRPIDRLTFFVLCYCCLWWCGGVVVWCRVNVSPQN